jgi:hypothetical protein
MSIRAGKVGTDGKEALRADATWTRGIGVIYLRKEENGVDRPTVYGSSRNGKPAWQRADLST